MAQYQYANELSEYDGAFLDAPDPDAPVPDGRYEARVTEATIVRGVKDPSQLFFKLTVEIPALAGATTSNLFPLTTADAKRMAVTKRLLRRLGYTHDLLSLLEDALPTFEGRLVEIEVRSNGNFQNVFVIRRLERLAEDTASPFEGDMPF
jgi:hypothetical protein